MDLPSAKLGWGGGRLGALPGSLICCLLVNRATGLAVEYLEPEVQEEKTGLEVEMRESSACGGYL